MREVIIDFLNFRILTLDFLLMHFTSAHEGLTSGEVSTLHDWVGMYESKYQVVGWLEGHPSFTEP